MFSVSCSLIEQLHSTKFKRSSFAFAGVLEVSYYILDFQLAFSIRNKDGTFQLVSTIDT